MRILFITASRIGDAVLSTGVLNRLSSLYPEARFTVACGQSAAELFARAPFVEQVIPMVKRRRAGHWLDLWRATVGRYWHMVVDLRGSALAYVVPTLRRRVITSSWKPEHRVVHLSRVLAADQAPLSPRLWISAAAETNAVRLLGGDGPILAVGPGANWGAKQWPAGRFGQVVARLAGPDGILPGARLAVFASASEREAILPVLQALPPARVIDLVGRLDLGTAAACLRRCAFYLGNDSGLMHMAAAAGIPTLGLFGPSSEVFYGPWGENCASVRGPRGFEDICHAPDYDYRSQECMMLDLEEDTVVEAATGLWARTNGREGA